MKVVVLISIVREKEEAEEITTGVQSKDSSSAALILCLKSLSFMETSVAISLAVKRKKCL